MLFVVQSCNLCSVYAQKSDEVSFNLPLISRFKYWVIAEEMQYTLNQTVGYVRPFSHYLTTVYFLLQLSSYHEKIGNEERCKEIDTHLHLLMDYSKKDIAEDLVGFTKMLKNAQSYLDEQIPAYISFVQGNRDNTVAAQGVESTVASTNQTNAGGVTPTWPTDKPLQPQEQLPAKNNILIASIVSMVAVVGGFLGLYYLMNRYVYDEADKKIADLLVQINSLNEWQDSKYRELSNHKENKVYEVSRMLQQQKEKIAGIEKSLKDAEATKDARIKAFTGAVEAYIKTLRKDEDNFKTQVKAIMEQARNDQACINWTKNGGVEQRANEATKAMQKTFGTDNDKAGNVSPTSTSKEPDQLVCTSRALTSFAEKLSMLASDQDKARKQ